MSEFAEMFASLGVKRTKKIYELNVAERKDAALNAVLIGLKDLNHYWGFALKVLRRVSEKWGDDIVAFYQSSGGAESYKPYPESGIPDAGQILCDVDKEFADLSERRRREIKRFFLKERMDAQWNAMEIGKDSVHRSLGFGDGRLCRLTKVWEADIRCFYEDRDIQEPRLKDWVEQAIGFVYENGKLQSYLGNDGKPIRKETAEKKLAEQDEKDLRQDTIKAKPNGEFRLLLLKEKITGRMIANELGIGHSTWKEWMHTEMPDEKKKRIIAAVNSIIARRYNDEKSAGSSDRADEGHGRAEPQTPVLSKW